MNKIALIAALAFSSAAFAADNAPKGTGNFRRAEVVKAAGANPKTAITTGIAIASQRYTNGAKGLPNSRIIAVQDGVKVTMVKAPLDKGEKVGKMSAADIHRAGMVTQAEARTMATKNGGELGDKVRVTIKDDGMTSSRSAYNFKQTSPSAKTIKVDGDTVKVKNINRAVTFTGSGETANGAFNYQSK